MHKTKKRKEILKNKVRNEKKFWPEKELTRDTFKKRVIKAYKLPDIFSLKS